MIGSAGLCGRIPALVWRGLCSVTRRYPQFKKHIIPELYRIFKEEQDKGIIARILRRNP
jgi:hypothetical protein